MSGMRWMRSSLRKPGPVDRQSMDGPATTAVRQRPPAHAGARLGRQHGLCLRRASASHMDVRLRRHQLRATAGPGLLSAERTHRRPLAVRSALFGHNGVLARLKCPIGRCRASGLFTSQDHVHL